MKEYKINKFEFILSTILIFVMMVFAVYLFCGGIVKESYFYYSASVVLSLISLFLTQKIYVAMRTINRARQGLPPKDCRDCKFYYTGEETGPLGDGGSSECCKKANRRLQRKEEYKWLWRYKCCDEVEWAETIEVVK